MNYVVIILVVMFSQELYLLHTFTKQTINICI